ncbi:Bor family protein [Dysgonomonas macrotermitis]|uniref:Bor protein n=1 Tax=Dysgonomonas macrotermitis TaxID=1346286 RepID=A0A1M5JST6_9BACT|nr:Bor family protein [Dysgonomonas macrotermitis]SHG43606.1 Bor protein [Dysgonomonas macrotermitis]
MKKLFLVSAIVLLASTFTSCYTSRVYHGSVTETTPQVEVASKSNPILLWGLLPLKKANQEAKDNVGNRKNYTTLTQWTFVDGLLNCITLGIYSPTTTKYYIPADEK